MSDDGSGKGSEREPRELDDVDDRQELRQRYQTLLQELRVVLPGVQVLMAFLLTAPFAERFDDLDDTGRRAYLTALLSALGSIVCLLVPTVFHRVAARTARAARLVWGVRLTLVGVMLLAVSLISSSWTITRLIFGTTTASVIGAASIVVVLGLWIVLPLTVGQQDDNE